MNLPNSSPDEFWDTTGELWAHIGRCYMNGPERNSPRGPNEEGRDRSTASVQSSEKLEPASEDPEPVMLRPLGEG